MKYTESVVWEALWELYGQEHEGASTYIKGSCYLVGRHFSLLGHSSTAFAQLRDCPDLGLGGSTRKCGLKLELSFWSMYFRNLTKCQICSYSSLVNEHLPLMCSKFIYGVQIMRVNTVLSKPCMTSLWWGLRRVIYFQQQSYMGWCSIIIQHLIWALADHLELLCSGKYLAYLIRLSKGWYSSLLQSRFTVQRCQTQE